ncbi:MAG: F0F1 ATP synthase subunit delta [Gammaproteobacteria bacterium]|nr:F0F1 ATP synthase subunit delta [Gammaproteobacteria bacterium]
MAEKQTLSRPYAKAIFDMAVQDSEEQLWVERLELLTQIVINESIHELVNNSESGEDKILELLFSLAEEISKTALDDKSKNLIKILAANKKITIIPTITEMYLELFKDSQGILEAEVSSAFSINDEQKKSIIDALTKKYNREVTVNIVIDESLVAGIIIRIGDEVIDGSVNTRLKTLARTLLR